MTAPSRLRVEHLEDPMGLTVRIPRMSWRLPGDAATQYAYQIRAGRWDSGRVEAADSVLVPYGGPALSSGERVDWTVRVWTDAGESDWAEPRVWEMGLLTPADWVAQWVAGPEGREVPADEARRALLFRGSCHVEAPVRWARLHVTAHGIYEFFVNGHRVGDLELTPGFTSYWTTLQVQTFDVSHLLRPGPNVLGAIVSGGWLKWTRRFRDAPLGLLAQLDVHQGDGSLARYGTGPGWVVTRGAIRSADLMEGQVVDLREERSDWSTPSARTDDWASVRILHYDPARLRSSPAPPVRRVQELKPVSVSRPRPDLQVIDLGQNINGWIRLANLGPVGTTLTLTHGESLDVGGDVTVEHIASDDAKLGRPFQTDIVTAGGRPGETFEPRHTTHGFRYVRVEGHPGEIGVDDAVGVVVHSDLARAGWFACSDERLNKLHDAAVWSFRGNACDIPTDCPTRERAGWTGDWQVFVSTAAFLYDVAGFSAKWLRDLAADQQASGVVPHCAPEGVPVEHQTAATMPPGSAGWGDAAVIVPWEIYRAYGDLEILRQQWPSMTAWVDHAARMARERRHPSRHARAVAEPHEQYLWDTGFHWGEWLEPGASLEAHPAAVDALFATLNTADHGSVATAYLHHSARLLAKIAIVLGHRLDAARYSTLADRAKEAWQREFLRSDGAVEPATQATYVRALAFGLVPAGLRDQLTRRLVALVRAADTHLGTGFLATPLLLPVLADHGHLDVAYELLLQDTEPSWLTMVDRGATTIWEHWNGIDDSGRAHHSLNHYSKGAVVSFLHRYTAGIQIIDGAPGYRRFRIAPHPGGGLTSARAAHESPYGRIEVSWSIDDDQFALAATIPPGTTAEICMPDGSTFDARPGAVRAGVTLPVSVSAMAGRVGPRSG